MSCALVFDAFNITDQMARTSHDALMFIDTNIFLDFYRLRGDTGGLSLLKHVDDNRSSPNLPVKA